MNKRKILLWILGLLVLFFLGFGLWIQVQFMLHDELQIKIDPVQSVATISSDTAEFTFSIRTSQFQFCTAQCNLTFVDAYSEEILESGTAELKNNAELVKEYSAVLGMNGKGQRIFYLYAVCQNQKTILCRTSGKVKYRSAIATVNREYTSEEQAVAGELNASIRLAYDRLMSSFTDEKFFNEVVNEIRASVPASLEPKNETEGMFDYLQSAIEKYYLGEFSESRLALGNITAPDYGDDVSRLNRSIEAYNRNVAVLRELSSPVYSEANDFLSRTNASRALQMQTLYGLVMNFSLDSFESVSEMESLAGIKEDVDAVVFNFTEEKKSFESEYNATLQKYIALLEKTGAVNVTGSLCADALTVRTAVDRHNGNVSSPEPSILHLISFINSSLFTVSSNSTHLISENNSILNDGGEDLPDYLEHVVYPGFSTGYCTSPVASLPVLTNLTEIQIISVRGSYEPLVLAEPARNCCIYGICTPCYADGNRYPVIFLHGHSVSRTDSPEGSVATFAKTQKKLSDEGVIVNAGDIDYNTVNEGLWSEMRVPVGVRGTYYYLYYQDVNSLSEVMRKEEGIDVYSLRLKEIIDLVLAQTGAEKVMIVAHSMGGLVTRNYLMIFGEEKVDRVLLIGTPNNGVTGKIDTFCAYFGDQKSCRDMSADSVFMKRLSAYVPEIPVYLLIGRGCETDGKDGDGVVQAESSFLPYANITYLDASCRGFMGTDMHLSLINPDVYPEVYTLIRSFIQNFE